MTASRLKMVLSVVLVACVTLHPAQADVHPKVCASLKEGYRFETVVQFCNRRNQKQVYIKSGNSLIPLGIKDVGNPEHDYRFEAAQSSVISNHRSTQYHPIVFGRFKSKETFDSETQSLELCQAVVLESNAQAVCWKGELSGTEIDWEESIHLTHFKVGVADKSFSPKTKLMVELANEPMPQRPMAIIEQTKLGNERKFEAYFKVASYYDQFVFYEILLYGTLQKHYWDDQPNNLEVTGLISLQNRVEKHVMNGLIWTFWNGTHHLFCDALVCASPKLFLPCYSKEVVDYYSYTGKPDNGFPTILAVNFSSLKKLYIFLAIVFVILFVALFIYVVHCKFGGVRKKKLQKKALAAKMAASSAMIDEKSEKSSPAKTTISGNASTQAKS